MSRRLTRALRFGLTQVVVIVVVLLSSAATAGAHATLLATEPAAEALRERAPSEVVLRFDEPVNVELGGGVRVFGPSGDRVDRLSTELRDDGSTVSVQLDGAAPGTYTVAWRVTSGDAHVLSGSFVFHIERETGAVAVQDDNGVPPGLAWLARWLVVVSVTVVAGLGLFSLRIDPDSFGPAASYRLVIVAAAAGVLGAMLRLAVQVAVASGRPLASAVGLWGEAVVRTRAGRLDGLRAAAALVGLVAAFRWPRRSAATIAMTAMMVVAALNSLGGHAWTSDRRWLGVFSDVVHQLAVAVWVGGLVGLLQWLRAGGADAGVVRRFSRLATGTLAVVLASGVASAFGQIGSLDALASSTYGRLLTAKVAGAALIVWLGWRNRDAVAALTVPPRLLAGVRMEVLAAVAVLGMTAALVGTVPARTVGGEVFSATIAAPSGTINVTVDPASPGANVMHLYFFDASGAPAAVDAAEATVALGDVPPRRVVLYPITASHFTAQAFSLPTAGLWTFALSTVSRGARTQTEFEVLIR